MARLLWLLLACCGASTAEARFLHTDADEVDREEGLRSEAFIDKLSYRQTWRLEERWRAHALGYQIGVGSIDANVFDTYEDVKLTTDPAHGFWIAYHRARREDVIERRTEDEVRLGWRLLGTPAYAALLADGGALKKWGDVGVAAGLAPDAARRVELYGFLVDPYYPTKEPDFAEDTYVRRPWSVGVRGSWQAASGAVVEGDARHDAPFRWERPSAGYHYDYFRQAARLSVRTPPFAGGRSLRLLAEGERKSERKEWLEPLAVKGLSRTAWSATLDARLPAAGDAVYEAGVVHLRRDATYELRDLPEFHGRAAPEWPSPDSRRRESSAFVTRHAPLAGSTTHFLQTGLYVAQVDLTRSFAPRGFGSEPGFHRLEAKLQTAWEIAAGAAATVYLNANWNLDRLAADFPYDESPFRPWNGGNLQLQAVF